MYAVPYNAGMLHQLSFYSLVTSRPESLDAEMVLLVLRMDRNRFTSECPDCRYPLPETVKSRINYVSIGVPYTLRMVPTNPGGIFVQFMTMREKQILAGAIGGNHAFF